VRTLRAQKSFSSTRSAPRVVTTRSAISRLCRMIISELTSVSQFCWTLTTCPAAATVASTPDERPSLMSSSASDL